MEYRDLNFLTYKEVAAHLKCSTLTVRRIVASGRLEEPLTIGRARKFTEKMLADYLALCQLEAKQRAAKQRAAGL